MKKISLVFISTILVLALIITGCSQKVSVDESVQNRKISEYSNPEEFITPEQLKSLMVNNKDLIVIGVLNSAKAILPGNIAGTPIEGSYTVWRPDYSGAGSTESISPQVGGYRKSKEEMENLLSKAGATPNSEIVVYAADAHHDAGRLYWQIKALGHKDVKILDGGLNAWVGAGYPTSSTKPLVDESPKTEYEAASYNLDNLHADIETVVEALNNPEEWVVIDTRSKDEFDGKSTGSSKGAFGTGRLKGTVHIEWTEALNEDTTLKSKEELEEIYGDIIKDKKVIVFCQSGVRSAFTYTVLKNVLGAENVYNYDGSWIEWSYTASEVSKGEIDESLRTQVLELTEELTDNKGAIK